MVKINMTTINRRMAYIGGNWTSEIKYLLFKLNWYDNSYTEPGSIEVEGGASSLFLFPAMQCTH